MEVVDLAKKYGLGDELDHDMYEKIQLLLREWQEDLDFEVAGSGMGGEDFSIDFSIVVPIGKELPLKVANLFFTDLDLNYSVKVRETDLYKKNFNERHFSFEIRQKNK